jgi:hypothetical protein
MSSLPFDHLPIVYVFDDVDDDGIDVDNQRMRLELHLQNIPTINIHHTTPEQRVKGEVLPISDLELREP